MIQVSGLSKKFDSRDLFHQFDLSIQPGSFNVITGPSGSGKSTLLSLLGLLSLVDEGVIELEGLGEVKPFSRQGRLARRNIIGFLHQNYALIDHDTVYQNLEMVLTGSRTKKWIKAAEALQRVGLEGYEDKRVYECSGGEQQRIAIARLLCKPCQLILADEPTGNLDEENKQNVLDLLKDLHQQGKTLIVATHDPSVIRIGQRTINLSSRVNTTSTET